MTIANLAFDNIKDMQHAFFEDRFGDRGEALLEIVARAGRAFNFDADDHAALPYYLYAASKEKSLNRLNDAIPIQLQTILAQPQLSFDGSKLNIIGKTFWEREDMQRTITDFLEAATAQAELTRRYFSEALHYTTVDAMMVDRMKLKHNFSTELLNDRRRLVLGATLSTKTARRVAGVSGTTVPIHIDVDTIIDSCYTNYVIPPEYYEIRFIRKSVNP